MHHYQGPNGTHFNFNSDMSGAVHVRPDEGFMTDVNGEDLIAFVTHWFREYPSDTGGTEPPPQPAPQGEPMTDEERAIWRSAYAAAFVEELRETENFFLQRHRAGRVDAADPFACAVINVTAENAVTTADAAVRRLRQWRAAERGLDGVTLGSWPEHWEP